MLYFSNIFLDVLLLLFHNNYTVDVFLHVSHKKNNAKCCSYAAVLNFLVIILNSFFPFRSLLEEGKATVPLLAERLTKELVEHITVRIKRKAARLWQKS